MNTFTLEIKEDGTWQQVTAVFPFTSGELLDERLDEGNVVFFSRVKKYKPRTEFRISFYKNGEPDYDALGKNIEYYVVANDNAAEYPSGSGRYKHETYIIERTKLLEGILCQSLAFTNALPIASRPIGNRVYATIRGASDLPQEGYGGYGAFYSPWDANRDIIIPSIADQAAALADSIKERDPTSTLVKIPAVGSNLTVYFDNEMYETTTNTTSETRLSPNDMEGKQSLIIRYRLVYIHSDMPSSQSIYTVTYEMQLTTMAALRPYSITDCVNRCLELAEPLRRGQNPRFTFEGVSYTDGVAGAYAEGSQAAKYDKIRAPEFTLTQSTLREQLKAIGAYIHAEPYLDENDVVHFLEYGQTEESGIGGKPYISNTVRWDINQYCTEIRSNAQNLTSSLGYAKGAKIEPARNLYRSLRSEMQYARINEQNTTAETDEPIYEITQVLCGLAAGNENISGWAEVGGVALSPKDITQYIFERTEYNSNLANSGFYPYAKPWALYYTQGDRNIEGLFYQPPSATDQASEPFAISNILAAVNGLSPSTVHDAIVGWFFGLGQQGPPCNIVFQITYKPISSAFISHGKQEYVEGEMPYMLVYNQSDNLVESEYYGENMKGVAARLGNVEAERTFLLSSRSQIPRVGYMLDDFSISAVACEYMPSYIKCTTGLTKKFNRISEFIGINSMKRMYEVSERQSQLRDILVKETLLITDNTEATSDSGTIFSDLSGVLNALNRSTYSGDDLVGHALVKTHKKNFAPISESFLMPVTARSFGNSIHFAFRFKDNYSAGSMADWETEGDISGRWQKDIPYTDNYGRAYWLNFVLYRGIADSTDASIAATAFELPDAQNAPLSIGAIAGTGGVDLLRLRKDNREIISLNYELEYKTDVPDLIIGSALAARCRYVNNFDTDNCVLRVTSEPINKLGRYLTGFSIAFSENYFTVSDDTLTLNFNASGTWEYKWWAIITKPTTKTETYIDEDGNTVEETVQSGGEILLAGKLHPPEHSSTDVSETFKFVIKK